ncbi:conserved hypothetical protein, partial [Ricinus communis]
PRTWLELLRRRQRRLHLHLARAEQLHLILQPHPGLLIRRRVHRQCRHRRQRASVIRNAQPRALIRRHRARVVLRLHRHHTIGLDKSLDAVGAGWLAHWNPHHRLAASAGDGQRRGARAIRHLRPAHIHHHALLARDLAGRLIQRNPRHIRGHRVIKRLLPAIEYIDKARLPRKHIQRRQGQRVATGAGPHLRAAFHRHAHIRLFRHLRLGHR